MNTLEHKEITAIKALPLSPATVKLAGELSKLVEEREAVNPAIARIMAKVDAMDTDKAVEQITPLRVKQEVVTAKLTAKRQACFAAIVADAGKWQDAAESAVEVARVAHADVKAQFAEKIKAAFNTKDSQKLMRGQAAAQSSEVQDAFNAYRKANETASLAGVARKCLDREHFVAKVEAGLAVSTSRPHVMEAGWYWRNAAIVCPALLD
jgi:hypothetical protein